MKYTLFVALLGLAVTARAQTPVIEFFDAHDNMVSDSSLATYYKTGMKKSTERSSSYVDTVFAYYIPSGKLKGTEVFDGDGYRSGGFVKYYENGFRQEEGTYERYRLVGRKRAWYPNGAQHSVIEYPAYVNDQTVWQETDFKILQYWDSAGVALVDNGNGMCRCLWRGEFDRDVVEKGIVRNGLRDGTWEGWRNGVLIFRERFSAGTFTGGTSFQNGAEIAYSEVYELARYPTGLDGLARFLSQNIHYPKRARRQGLEGVVYISFVIDKEGALQDVAPVKYPDSLLADEAMRVVKAMKSWTPARHRGLEVKSRYVLPIKFRLQ